MTPTTRAVYALLGGRARCRSSCSVPIALAARGDRRNCDRRRLGASPASGSGCGARVPRVLARGRSAALAVARGRRRRPSHVELRQAAAARHRDRARDRERRGASTRSSSRTGAASTCSRRSRPGAPGRSGSDAAPSTARAPRRCSCIPTSSPRNGSWSRCGAVGSAIPGLRTRGPARARHRLRIDPRLPPRRRRPPDQLDRDRARRAADEQRVPHRAGPRRRVPARCRPADGARRSNAIVRRDSTPPSTRSRWSRSSPTSSATGAA